MSSLPLGPQPHQDRTEPDHFGPGGVRPLRHPGGVHGGDAMYYGLNALSNNMILLDRKQSRCPNGPRVRHPRQR